MMKKIDAWLDIQRYVSEAATASREGPRREEVEVCDGKEKCAQKTRIQKLNNLKNIRMTYFLKSVLRVVCSPLREALKPRLRIPTRHAVWNI